MATRSTTNGNKGRANGKSSNSGAARPIQTTTELERPWPDNRPAIA